MSHLLYDKYYVPSVTYEYETTPAYYNYNLFEDVFLLYPIKYKIYLKWIIPKLFNIDTSIGKCYKKENEKLFQDIQYHYKDYCFS